MIPLKHKKTAFALLVVGIVLAIFQVVTAILFYDSSVQLYHFGIVPKILNILLALYVIGVVIAFAVFKNIEYPDSAPKSDIVSKILSGLCAVALLMCGGEDLLAFIESKSNMMHITTRQDTFIMWSGILFIVGVAYFVLNAAFEDKAAKLIPWFGSVLIIWFIMRLLSVYFDMTSPLNDPIRLINEFALTAGMLFVAGEIRYKLKFAKKGFYISVCLVAVTFLLASGTTGIICTLTEIIPKTRDFWGYVFEFVFAFYVLYTFINQLLHTEEVKEVKEEVAPSILETNPDFKNYI